MSELSNFALTNKSTNSLQLPLHNQTAASTSSTSFNMPPSSTTSNVNISQSTQLRRGSLKSMPPLQLRQSSSNHSLPTLDNSNNTASNNTNDSTPIQSNTTTLKKSNSVPSALKSAMTSTSDAIITAVNKMEIIESSVLKVTRGSTNINGPTVDDWRLTTQDYDDINDHTFDVEIESTNKYNHFLINLIKFSMTVMISLVTALAMWGVRVIVDLCLSSRNSATLQLISDGSSAGAFFQMFAASIAMCSGAAALCVYIAPNARGGGVPYVQAYLNGTNVNEFFGYRIVLVKIVSLALCVAGGLTIGREGPFVYIGGGIAMICCKIVDFLTMNNRNKWARSIRNIKEERIFIAGGMAAGLAVAFSAPIAGVLLAMEGTTAFITQIVLLRIFCCAMFAMLFSDLTYNNWSYLIKNHNLIAVKKDSIVEYNYMISEIFAFICIGIIGGCLGALATYLNVSITKWRHHKQMEKRTIYAIAEVACIAGITVIAFFTLPYVFGCREINSDCVSTTTIETPCRQTQCPDGYYSDIGTIIYSTSDQVAALLFNRATELANDFSIAPLLMYGTCYFCLVSYVYGSMIPGGLFVPSIIIGGIYGRVFGIIAAQVNENINSGVYALLGAAAMLGGFTRLVLPIAVMLIELTGDATYLLPIMLCCVLGKQVADMLTAPLYPQHMAIENIPVLTDKLPDGIAVLAARDIMKTQFSSVCRYDSLCHILDTLDRSKSIVLPVTSLDGTFYGVIKRTQLIVAMKLGTLYDTVQDAQAAQLINHNHELSSNHQNSFTNTSGSQPHKPVKLDKRLRQLDWCDVNDYTQTLDKLNDGMDDKCLDLTAYIDSGVLAVHETTSTKRCSVLFRKLGISHLMVTNVQHKLVGVITRRNLLVNNSINQHPHTGSLADTQAINDNESGTTSSPPDNTPSSNGLAIHVNNEHITDVTTLTTTNPSTHSGHKRQATLARVADYVSALQ